MNKVTSKLKKYMMIVSLVLVILLLATVMSKILSNPTDSDVVMSSENIDQKVEVDSIVVDSNDEYGEVVEITPDPIIIAEDNQVVTENAPPEEKPQLDPPKDKPDSAPPQELLDENPNYISAADLEEEEDPDSTVSSDNIITEEPINPEPSNLVPADQNPFINAGQNTDVDVNNGSDYGEGEWGNGDKF
jgi:hypothetical protein